MYTLCIAEDEYYVQKSIENRVLALNKGIELKGCAYTGAEAEALYDRCKPDVFFVDIRMPQGSGLDFIEKIRRKDRECTTLFVIISGFSDYQNMHRAIKAGIFDYLEKPIVPDEFEAMMNRVVSALDQIDTSMEIDYTFFDNPVTISDESRKNTEDRMRQVLDYIHENYKEDLNAKSLSEILFLSPSYLSHEFKKTTGQSIGKYLEEVRLNQAERLLVKTDLKIAEIGWMVGYEDQNYFTKVFRKKYEKTPSEYRKGVHNIR